MILSFVLFFVKSIISKQKHQIQSRNPASISALNDKTLEQCQNKNASKKESANPQRFPQYN